MTDDELKLLAPAMLHRLAGLITGVTIAGIAAGEKPAAEVVVRVPLEPGDPLIEHWLGLALGVLK